jgi:hypothetical protein
MKKIFESFKEKLNESEQLLKVVAYVSTGHEDDIENNAKEDNITIDWKVLNKEIEAYEATIIDYLRKTKGYEYVMDQGHDSQNDLIIVFDISDKKLKKSWDDLIDREGRFSFNDSTFSADKGLFSIVDKLADKSKYLKYCILEMSIENITNENKTMEADELIIDYRFLKKWSNIVINKGENNNEYDNKAPIDWDGDNFVSWVSDNLDSKDQIADDDLAKVLGLKKGTNLLNTLENGSGFNYDKEFKKYGNWRSALYDFWFAVTKKL